MGPVRAHAWHLGRSPASDGRAPMATVRKLHHSAYRCRDSEATRRFYEDFLGLLLAGTLEINESKSGRPTQTLPTFKRLDDGSFIAFFEAEDMPFKFETQHDFDLRFAFEGRAQRPRPDARESPRRGPGSARCFAPRLRRLSLLPRPQRPYGRVVRQSRSPRCRDEPGAQ